MGTVIASILIIAVVLLGVLTVSNAAMNAVLDTTLSGNEIGKMISEKALTSIDVATATYIATATWSQVMVLNDGRMSIGDFDKWDFFMHYRDTATSNYMHYQRIPYSSTYPPGNDQWAKNGIYLDLNATITEQYEPNILNPGEYLKLAMKVQNTISTGTWVYIKGGTPNGINDNIQYRK